jgi:hypothetical protein
MEITIIMVVLTRSDGTEGRKEHDNGAKVDQYSIRAE